MVRVSKIRKAALRRKVSENYRMHGRHSLAWRRTHDPYRILVSEVMLQQTQVSRVIEKYPKFIRAYPNLFTLARAPLPRLLRLWQGLGYNRRVLSLKRLARQVVVQSNGQLPQTLPDLEALPGVGPYTARAILALAYNQPVALLETNIRKVILHEFFPRRKRVHDQEVMAVAQKLLDKKRPREWNLALMDYGAAKFGSKFTNPNQRSQHYAKQSRYQGSRRFIRAKLTFALLRRRSASQPELAQILARLGVPSRSQQWLPEILGELEREGFICKQGSRYTLARGH